MRAADAEQTGDAGLDGGRQDRRLGPRAGHDDLADAGDSCRHRGHQQRRRERKPAAGHVASDPRQRLETLFDHHPRCDGPFPPLRQLIARDAGDVDRRLLERAAHVAPGARRPRADLAGAQFERRRYAVEPPGEFDERAIAVAAHARDQPLYPPLELLIGGDVRMQNRLDRSAVAGLNDADRRRSSHTRCVLRNHLPYSTILFNGYSTIP